MSPPPARVNPFPGLRPFTPEEDYLFFGREEQTLELLQRLAINRFVAVVGTSGSGKSSLVRCGLLSELLGGRMLEAGASWEIAVTHPGGNPLGHLTDALLDAELYDRREEHARENLLATLSRSHFGLVEAVKQADLGDGTNFLIVVDQFEEIFRFHEAGQTQQEAANEFVSLLLEAAAQKEMPIYVVLTMRSDFIGECGQFEGLAEMVNRGEFLIPRLTREQYKRVIEGPIKVAGGQIAPRLLQRLLNDLGQQADQLPCLQHALMRTWDVWTAQGDTDALDLDDYQLVGKMSQALSLHADEIYQSLASDHQRALCQGMFQALTVEESNGRGIRRPQRLGRLCQILEVPADELLPIIDAYRHRGVTFLMPSPEIGLTEQTIIDISHESLMRVWARLRQWVEEETQAAGIYRRLSESAYLHKQGKAGLYRDPELGIALAWREAKRPNAAWADRYRSGFGAAIAFLDASQQASVAEEQSRESARQRELEHARRLAESQQLRLEQQQRSARKLRRLIGGLAVVAVIAGLACVTAMIANQRANTQAENARQNAEKANTSAAQARQSQQEADLARAASEESREAAQAEAYRAVLSEARALRAGHQPGWRDEALADLARLATSPSSKRNLLELRTEAVAALGTPDVRLIARIEPPGGFESFGFSPDGPTLMTAGRGGLDFWNVQELKHVAASEEAAVAQASWTALRKKALYLPHGQGLAVATPDQGVVFTDLTGKRTARPPITRGAHSPVQLSADSEGRRIAVNWSGGGKLTVHNLESGETLGEFLDSQSALSPDGRWIAHEGPQFEVLLNRIGSKEPEKSLGHHNGKIVNFAFSPDGNTLGSTSWDKTATLWDVAGRKQPVVLRGHRETVNDLAFSPDGGWVATASTDFTARIWDVPTGQSLAMLPGPYFAVRVAWSSDGSFLAVHSSTDNNSVDLYRITGRRIFQRLVMHQHGVQCVAANPRLDRLATGADDHVVIDWDLTTAQPSRRKSGTHPTFVTAVAYSPDGSLLASGAGDGSLVVRDAETGETKARLTGHKVQIRALAFDSSGQRLASGDQSGRVIVWDLSTKQPMQQLYVGPSWVWSIAFLDDGRKLVSEVSNGPVAVFDLQSGKPEAQITLPGGIRRFIADPARKRLIVAFNNGDLCSLSTPDLAPGHRLEHAHPSAIESLTLSPDGRLLATGGADGRVVFRDPVTFEPLLAFPEWTAMVKDLAFTPSARHLAYVGADSDVALWDLTLVQEGLEAAGLAWDRPAPATVPATRPAGATEQLRSAVPVIRRAGTVNPVEYDQARRLVLSGVGAFENGRLSEAVRDLQQARDRLRTLRKAAPGDRQVASQLAISLGFLGSAFKNDHRPADALVSLKEARQVLEAIREPSFMDLYNLACTYSNLTTLAEPGSVSPSTAENEAMAERAMETLQRSLAAGMNDRALMDRDHDLDPLRERPDFRALILQSSGRTREAVPYLAEASAAKPKDTLFSLKVAALQAWFGQDKELAVTRQRILSFAKDTSDAGTAERTAKACSILPSSDKAELEAALGLGRTAVKLSKGEWNLLALGMAEYRSGNYAAANEALLAAAQAGPNNSQIGGISAFFRAMSLFRQGKADEAQTLANAAAAKLKPMPKDENNPLAGDATTEDLILWMAHKEARSLLK